MKLPLPTSPKKTPEERDGLGSEEIKPQRGEELVAAFKNTLSGHYFKNLVEEGISAYTNYLSRLWQEATEGTVRPTKAQALPPVLNAEREALTSLVQGLGGETKFTDAYTKDLGGMRVIIYFTAVNEEDLKRLGNPTSTVTGKIPTLSISIKYRCTGPKPPLSESEAYRKSPEELVIKNVAEDKITIRVVLRWAKINKSQMFFYNSLGIEMELEQNGQLKITGIRPQLNDKESSSAYSQTKTPIITRNVGRGFAQEITQIALNTGKARK